MAWGLGQLAGIHASAACDRARSPLDDPGVAAAVADVVAVVEVDKLGGGQATAQVVLPLKGTIKKGDTLTLRDLFTADEGVQRGKCGVSVGAVHKRYLVSLWSPPAGSPSYELVDPLAAVQPYDAATQSQLERAIASPQPHSAWQASPPGLQAQLLLDAAADRSAGEINLVVLVRNTTPAALAYTYTSWPEAEQSKCALQITDPAKQLVAAREVPIPKPDIAAYFAKNRRVYKTMIPPGKSYLIPLQRITTAAPGWGYKEELGFHYYPIVKHGPHRVAAECVNYFGSGSRFKTAELALDM